MQGDLILGNKTVQIDGCIPTLLGLPRPGGGRADGARTPSHTGTVHVYSLRSSPYLYALRLVCFDQQKNGPLQRTFPPWLFREILFAGHVLSHTANDEASIE